MMFPDKALVLEALHQISVRWDSDMPGTSKDRIKFLIRELEFLHIFLRLQSFTDLSEKLDVDVTHKVQALFQDVTVDLKKVNKIQHVDRFTSPVLEKTQIAKSEIREVYFFPKALLSNKDGIDTPKFVMEFIDTVIGNLADLVNICDSCSLLFVPGPKKELGDVFKELKLLRHFVRFVSDRSIEPKSQHIDFFTHVLVVAGDAAMVAWLYLPKYGDDNQESALAKMNEMLSDLLHMKIKPIQPYIRKIYIDVLQALRSTIQSQRHPIIQIENAADCAAGFVETLQHNLHALRISNHQKAAPEDMLNLLVANLIHLSDEDLEFHIQDIDTVMIDSGLLVYSLCEEVSLEEMTIDWPSTIQRIKTLIYHINRKEFQSNLPRIHGIGYVDFLLHNLKELTERYPDELAFVQSQLQTIQTELKTLQFFIKSVAVERHNNHDKLQHSVALLIGRAYEVEYTVDACVSNQVPDWCIELWILDLREEITAEVAKIQILKVDSASHDTIDTDTSTTSSVLARTQRIDNEIVGFEKEIETLRRQLTGGCKGRDIISIVGMPGAGKTALANRLYSDESVVSHFDVRAQCYVSSVYSRRELLLSILATLPISSDETSLLNKDTNDLADMLRKILYSRRYLILVDDVPDVRVLDDLERCFYDANNRSRILLTTRHSKVAYRAKSDSKPLVLRMLDDGESWTLLKKRVFGEGICSPILEKVGPKIAGKCGGLPLSIVFVACVLARKEKTEQCWKQFARSLGSEIPCYPEDIIEQSYQNLPYHLKSCFLYFGMFSDHEEINISKLTLLWIGEGFVKDDKEKSLEDVAKSYLENLVENNLVMIAKRNFGDNVKECCIHDILLHFCKEKADKENLIQRIQWSQRDVYSCKQLARRRLAFYAKVDLAEWSSSCSLVSSVLFKGANANASSSIAQASNIFHNFKFLKVLDLEFTVIDSFPTKLVYLRYFAAQTSQGSITSSIDKLWNLETLIVNSTKGTLSVPMTVWKMAKLRHLRISPCFTSEELSNDSSKLCDLRTFSTPYFSCAKDAELMLRKAPTIQELRCKFEGVSSGHDFPVLLFPTRLEMLDIFCDQSREAPPYLVLISASNLNNLKVSFFRLGRQHLSNIAQLRNLQELELNSVEFEDNKWKVSSDEFPKLKVLKLQSLIQLEEWTIDEGAFPKLEHLVLHDCELLNKIPSCFEDILSLKSIEVWGCRESIARSARDIKKIQFQDIQNSSFKVFIDGKEYISDSGDYDDDEDYYEAAEEELDDEY